MNQHDIYQENQHLKPWLRLHSTEGIGSKTALKLLQRCNEQQIDLDELFQLSEQKLISMEVLSKKQIRYLFEYTDYQIKVYDETILWLNENQKLHHLVTFDMLIEYNPLIAQMPDIPLLVFAKGNINLLKNKMLGVVGTRNPSSYGLRHAKHFSQFLSEQNITIISGLAQGIDGAAHEGAILNIGNTIAVVGTGLDRVYPSVHKALAHEIVEKGGLIISEFVLGTPAIASNFPKRNRLIAGFSTGLLVVEATQRSGSLITARLALEMNREVFAIPGSIDSPLTKGCHQLIKQGATLVEQVQDIAQQLQDGFINVEKTEKTEKIGKITNIIMEQKSNKKPPTALTDVPNHVVFEYLIKQPESTSLESLCLALNIAVPELTDLLFNWEMEDLIEKTDGGYQVKKN